jgi:hypothetical protein
MLPKHDLYDQQTFPSEVEMWLRVALDDRTPTVGPRITVPTPLNKSGMGDLLGATASAAEPVAVFMKATTYAGLRRHVRNYLDIECYAWVLKLGVQCRVRGVPLVTSREVGQGVVWIVGRGPDGWVRQEGHVPFPGSIYVPPGVYC